MARPHNAPDPFRAIAHPVRRRMLDMLRARPMSVADLSQPFRMAQPSITGHIRALRVAGLIEFRTRGPRHIYSLLPDRLEPIDRWIRAHRRAS